MYVLVCTYNDCAREDDPALFPKKFFSVDMVKLAPTLDEPIGGEIDIVLLL